MKKAKFFAMLFAAFAMSVSFTACGDDDDEPGHETEQPTTGPVNELSIDGQKVNFTHGTWTEMKTMGYDCVVIELENESGLNPWVEMTVFLFNTKPANENIPTGTYKHLSRNTLDEPCYLVLLNLWETSDLYDLNFESEEDSNDLKLERKGGEYTLTMSKLILASTDEDNQGKTETTSFTYKGQITYEHVDFDD